MARRQPQPAPHQQVAVFFLEGYSEEVFYKRILTMYLDGIPKVVINVKGLYNIHKNVLGKSIELLRRKPGCNIRIYCCIDRESRDRAPELDIDLLKKDISNQNELKGKVLSAEIIVATQMLESWFFYDIDGIYKYLKTPKANRNPGKFRPIEKTKWQDLYRLFADAGKLYMKGLNSDSFVDHLDLAKIYNNCNELRDGIERVRTNSESFKSDL